jgi:hypothetical protein
LRGLLLILVIFITVCSFIGQQYAIHDGIGRLRSEYYTRYGRIDLDGPAAGFFCYWSCMAAYTAGAACTVLQTPWILFNITYYSDLISLDHSYLLFYSLDDFYCNFSFSSIFFSLLRFVHMLLCFFFSFYSLIYLSGLVPFHRKIKVN